MPPPAPDILCRAQSGEEVAFELVELIDQDYARGLNVLFRTLKMLRELPARLPQDVRGLMEKRIGPGRSSLSSSHLNSRSEIERALPSTH